MTSLFIGLSMNVVSILNYFHPINIWELFSCKLVDWRREGSHLRKYMCNCIKIYFEQKKQNKANYNPERNETDRIFFFLFIILITNQFIFQNRSPRNSHIDKDVVSSSANSARSLQITRPTITKYGDHGAGFWFSGTGNIPERLEKNGYSLWPKIRSHKVCLENNYIWFFKSWLFFSPRTFSRSSKNTLCHRKNTVRDITWFS